MRLPWVLSLLLVLSMVGCSAPSPAVAVPPQDQAPQGQREATQLSEQASQESAALQKLLDEEVRKQRLPGMIMAVRLADGTVVSRSAGHTDPTGKNVWSVDTVSALGSVTKSYVAVVVMQLVEVGKLSLDDTIDAWFPDQPNGDRITVRMLLSHTSGLADRMPDGTEQDPKWTEEWAPLDLVAEANRQGPVGEPGSSVAHYTNTNYILLGLIVEAITGNSLHQEIRARIIEPLDLEHTAFGDDDGIRGGIMVEGYVRTADGYMNTLDLPSRLHPSTAWAVGDVVSSVGDLLTFASALFDGRLVSKESLAEMGTPLGTDPQSGLMWGLGGATVPSMPGSFGMGGENTGYRAFYAGIQETKLAVAALVNTEEGDVIGPSLTALEYVRSLPEAGQAPAR